MKEMCGKIYAHTYGEQIDCEKPETYVMISISLSLSLSLSLIFHLVGKIPPFLQFIFYRSAL